MSDQIKIKFDKWFEINEHQTDILNNLKNTIAALRSSPDDKQLQQMSEWYHKELKIVSKQNDEALTALNKAMSHNPTA